MVDPFLVLSQFARSEGSILPFLFKNDLISMAKLSIASLLNLIAGTLPGTSICLATKLLAFSLI